MSTHLQLPCALDAHSAWSCSRISIAAAPPKPAGGQADPAVLQKIRSHAPYYFQNGHSWAKHQHQAHQAHQHHQHHQLHQAHPGYYSPHFVSRFLLIKINSLLQPECHVSPHFTRQLAAIFNIYSSSMPRVVQSGCDEEIMAQLILQFKLQDQLRLDEAEDVLQGKAYVATVLLHTYHEGELFVEKAAHSLALAHRALEGKASPFFHKVHSSKNHHGQTEFARRLSQLASLTPQLAVSQVGLGQDPYSLRCAPQICGVAVDCLQLLKEHLPKALNNFHFKYVHIGEETTENVSLWADSEQLLNDFALAALHEIGCVVFVRTERLLNEHLAKTNLQDSSQPFKHFQVLKRALERTMQCLSDNRLLCSPATADTMNLHNYEADVFRNDGKAYQKHLGLFHNLHHMLTLELLCSMAAIKRRNGIHNGLVFDNETMNKSFHHLDQHLTPDSFLHSLDFVANHWHP